MTPTLDDILCARCKNNRGFRTESIHNSKIFCISCAVVYGMSVYPHVECEYFVEAEKYDCKGGSPYDVGWCTGDCKKCPKNTEWQVWVK